MIVPEVSALSKLRHLYKNMVSGGVKDASEAKRIAEGLLSPAIAAIESLHAEVEALRGGWKSIETAPKDGTWVMLWRTPEPLGSVMQSDPFIIARWSGEYEEFVWPDSPFDPFTPHGRSIANAIVDEGRRIFGTDDFTHWMPLPTPPAQEDGK